MENAELFSQYPQYGPIALPQDEGESESFVSLYQDKKGDVHIFNCNLDRVQMIARISANEDRAATWQRVKADFANYS